MADTILGVKVDEVYKTPEFLLGTVVEVADKEFIFIKAGETFGSANAAVVLNFENEGELLTQTNFENGQRVGVTELRPSADEYLWLQVRGTARIRVAASCDARARLYATETAGVLDDASGAYYVYGIRTTTLNGLAVAEQPCRLYNPKVGEAPGEGGGGGGGSDPIETTTGDATKITFSEGNATIDFTATNAAVDTGIAVPANTVTISVNYGASATGDNQGLDLAWYPIPIEEWERLDGVDVGDTPTKGNVRFTRIWRDSNVTTVGGVGARQVWISKGNNGNIFVMTDNTGWDIHPFRVRFEIHEDVSAVTSVTGGGGSGGGSGLSQIPILAPDAVPDRDDWVDGAAQWTGEKLAPIVRELVTAHGAIGRFATISDTDGLEIIELTAAYATMRAGFGLRKSVFWEHGVGQAVEIGDAAYRTLAGVTTYYYCIRAHTSIAGDVANGPPNLPSQTGWQEHTRQEVYNKAKYKGVHYNGSTALAALGEAAVSAGDWIVITQGGVATPLLRNSNDTGWSIWAIPDATFHRNILTNNFDATEEIRESVVGTTDYFYIDGRLKILNFYVEPEVGEETYHTGAVYYNNPTAEFWGVGQTERRPSGWPNTDDGTLIRRLRFADASAGPHKAYDGGEGLGNIFIPVADVSANIDAGTNLDDYTVFRLTTGRYHFRLHGASNARTQNHGGFGIHKVTVGTDDTIITANYHRTNVTTAGEAEGTLSLAAVWNEDILEDDQYYCAAIHIDDNAENTRHYLEIERVG